MTTEQEIELLPLDTSEVEKWVGQPVYWQQLKEPIATNDIRRWAQGMQNPNPLYYDENYARESVFGEIVAPQSFTVCCDTGHGSPPGSQGRVPGSHLIFGGDEWWFFGPRIRPGDKIHCSRMSLDYKVTSTKFAGPTLFQRGDTTYINQLGEVIARQRSTNIRYLVENARRLNSMKDQEAEPEWTDEQLEKLEQDKLDYYQTFHRHIQRRLQDVGDEEVLPTGIIGPHSIRSFTTEWRSFIMTVWGSKYDEAPFVSERHTQQGWLPEMKRDFEAGKINPAQLDGIYHGPSSGHANPDKAKLIGMPRPYGYGASMGAWVLDYVGNWAGELALTTHSDIKYRGPALTGDVTYLNGRVISKGIDPLSGEGLVTVRVEMTTQTGTQMAVGPVEVRFPRS